MKTTKLLKYAMLFILIQIIFGLLSFISIFDSTVWVFILFPINAFISWYIMKKVEKMYYKKYNKWASMLYNICPLIGVSLVFGFIFYYTKFVPFLLVTDYYILLFIFIYLINLGYVIYNLKHK